MHYRILGKTGLKVSLMGFGTGGPSSFGQSSGLTVKDQTALVRRCFDLGINIFDTSSHYGRSEEVLGIAVKDIPRDSYILSSKWPPATKWSPPGMGGKDGPLHEDAQVLTSTVETSLKRFGTDYLDLFYFHGVRPEQYHQVVDKFYPAMKRLQEQGKIRFIGLTTRFIVDPGHDVIVLALKNDPELWDVVMLKYGILNQYAAKEALPLAQKHGIGVLNMASVRIKLPDLKKLEELIGEWKQKGLISPESLPEKNPLGWLVHDEVGSVISAAYKFAAEHPAVSTVLTGTANITHLEENVAALEKPSLPASDRQKLNELFGHIAEYA